MTTIPILLEPAWASSDKLAGKHLATGFSSPQPLSPSGVWAPFTCPTSYGRPALQSTQLPFGSRCELKKKGEAEDDATLPKLPKLLEPQRSHVQNRDITTCHGTLSTQVFHQ